MELTKKDFKGLVFVASLNRGHKTIWCDTIENLRSRVFGYTLECGNSWNPKINRYPKTLKSLITALTKSAEECNRYSQSYYASDWEEYVAAGGTLNAERRGSVTVR